jgi:hypothetical protein
MGIRRKWQNSQVGAILALSIMKQATAGHLAHDIAHGEMSWILDSNERMKHIIALLGGTAYKRYRIYEKALS